MTTTPSSSSASSLLTPQGLLTSLDDFYILGSSLLMTQTSIGVFNVSLFSQLSPHSLLAWQRVRLANSLAHSGEEWAHIFSKYNSGEILLMWVKTRGVESVLWFLFQAKEGGTKQALTHFLSTWIRPLFLKLNKICRSIVLNPILLNMSAGDMMKMTKLTPSAQFPSLCTCTFFHTLLSPRSFENNKPQHLPFCNLKAKRNGWQTTDGPWPLSASWRIEVVYSHSVIEKNNPPIQILSQLVLFCHEKKLTVTTCLTCWWSAGVLFRLTFAN